MQAKEAVPSRYSTRQGPTPPTRLEPAQQKQKEQPRRCEWRMSNVRMELSRDANPIGMFATRNDRRLHQRSHPSLHRHQMPIEQQTPPVNGIALCELISLVSRLSVHHAGCQTLTAISIHVGALGHGIISNRKSPFVACVSTDITRQTTW